MPTLCFTRCTKHSALRRPFLALEFAVCNMCILSTRTNCTANKVIQILPSSVKYRPSAGERGLYCISPHLKLCPGLFLHGRMSTPHNHSAEWHRTNSATRLQKNSMFPTRGTCSFTTPTPHRPVHLACPLNSNDMQASAEYPELKQNSLALSL